ncbi:Glutathione import ATP-binding protein GsiA [Streptobacillus moniliformis]|nr:Glutathione import ATP-binding protein GsiA [Streptobacillus moniliformis]
MGDKQQDEVLLEVKDLITSFRIKDTYHNAVDGVSFDLKKNEVLAIVGESGCGKSTLATSIMGLHNFIYTKVSGEIKFEGNNLVDFTEKDFNNIRGAKIGMIFQDPLSALNPLMRIGDQIEEGLKYHTTLTFEERQNRVKELITKVGINNPERVMKQFPHELSGGMRQRIIIAIALSCKPDILIADEPTTALDVTIQAQILDYFVNYNLKLVQVLY